MQIWLQRISYPLDNDVGYAEPLCNLVAGSSEPIWNIDWISFKDLKDAIDISKIINKDRLQSMPAVIPSEEVELFISKQLEGY